MTSYASRLRAVLTWLKATDEAQSLIEDAEAHRNVRNIQEQSAVDLSRNVLFRDTTRAEGDMRPEDLEGFGKTSGYDNIMTLLKTARPEELEYWTKWYTYAQKAVATLADRYDIPMNVACAVVAVLSPGCKFLQNLKVANAVFAGSEVNNGAYPRNFAKAKKILETGDTSLVTGPKVTVFYKSLLDPESTKERIVLDGHAINIWRGHSVPIKGIRQPTEEERERMLADYRKAASDFGITPQGAQALTWYLWKTARASNAV